jgi:hypothetical protein
MESCLHIGVGEHIALTFGQSPKDITIAGSVLGSGPSKREI